ncbi:hypothetical protein RN24_11915 [Yersinia pestis subsp. microtus bv. Ulegeica]|nr:hypothetical protein RN24_11915 [Yersinia pestis subsp. microtus bv. Ulegeica]
MAKNRKSFQRHLSPSPKIAAAASEQNADEFIYVSGSVKLIPLQLQGTQGIGGVRTQGALSALSINNAKKN